MSASEVEPLQGLETGNPRFPRILLRRGEPALVARDVTGLTLVDAYERLLASRPLDRPILFDDPGNQWGAIGLDPIARLTLRDEWRLESPDRSSTLGLGGALRQLRETLREWAVAPVGEQAFVGGWAGFFGFEFAAELERLRLRRESDLPRADLAFCTAAIVATAGGVRVTVLEREGPRAAAERLQAIVEGLRHARSRVDAAPPPSVATSSFSRDSFERAAKRTLDFIREGHTYQVNLAQRFAGLMPFDGWSAYARARARNPSPFMGYVPGDGWSIACNSPERLVTTRGRDALTSPIAGTRPRGPTAPEDDELEAELRRDPKENAEHVMLVDLERNDLGKACEFGSVRVAPHEYMGVERYSHVMHLVSHVRGRLRREADALAAMLALFPGGTITGVPKVRACEIIGELEPVPRGPYTGSLGYLSVNGASDWNLIIRTLVAVGGEGRVHVGAGIVADSEPRREYEETLAKGRHWFEVLGWRPGA